MVAYNFGAPAINFAPLGQLGDRYAHGIKQRHDQEIAARREAALAGFGQNGDLAALGKTLLQAGDLEGGMSALRLAQAGQGTPWQREQAAKEQERYEAGRADIQTQRAKEEERYQETQRRLNQPRYEKEVDTDGEGNPIPGLIYPDGRVKPLRPGGTGLGPQSGGASDPSLPAPDGSITQAQLGSPVPGSTAERGFVIPGTLEGFPHGTTRMAGAEGFNNPAVAGLPNMPAIGSVEAQATLPAPGVAGKAVAGAPPGAVPLAPPAVAGTTAVAAPAQAQAAPQRRLNREDPLEPPTVPFVRAPPPHVNIKGWIAGEVERVKKVTGPEGSEVTSDMKNKLARARRTAQTVERELDALDKDVKEYGLEFMPGTVKTRMNTTYTNLLMQLKEMYELGALQAHDIEMVKGLLTNPTAVDPVEGAARSFFQKDITAQQVAKLKQIVKDGMRAAEESLGGDPTRVTPSADPRLEKPLDVGGSRELGGGVTITRVK